MADLAGLLARAYDHSWQAGTLDPTAECQATVPREALEAKLAALRPVQVRCHVSRVHVRFLERVLAGMAPRT